MDLLNLNMHRRGTKASVGKTIYDIDASGVCKDVSEEHAKELLQGKSWCLWDGTNPTERLKAERVRKRKQYLDQKDGENAAVLEREIEDRVKAKLLAQGWRPPKEKRAPKKGDTKKAPEPTPEEDPGAQADAETAQRLMAIEEERAKAQEDADKALVTTPEPVPESTQEAPEAQAEGTVTPPLPSEADAPADAPTEAPDATEADSEAPETEEDPEDPPIPVAEGEEWENPDPRYSIEWLKACADAYEVPYPGNIGPDTLCEKILKAMY